jgi:hypothetical protein
MAGIPISKASATKSKSLLLELILIVLSLKTISRAKSGPGFRTVGAGRDGAKIS